MSYHAWLEHNDPWEKKMVIKVRVTARRTAQRKSMKNLPSAPASSTFVLAFPPLEPSLMKVYNIGNSFI